MRKFALRNAIGEIYPMDGSNGILFLVPQGLGFSSSPAFADLRYGFFTDVNNTNEPMNQVAGEIAFIGDPYGKYNSFVNWLNSGYALELMYQPRQTQYFRRIEVASLSKGELERTGYLRCPVVLNCLTPWYKPNPINVNIMPQSGVGKRYAYKYPYNYAPSSVTGAVEILSAGHIDGAIKMKLNGPITSPDIVLTNLATGEVVGNVSLDITLSAGQVLELSTVPGDSYITVDGEDIISKVNILDNIFFRIPRNTTCLLSVENSGGAQISSQISVYDYYRSV